MADAGLGLLSLLGNLTFDAGGCPEPFISESLYPFEGGYYAGRNCAENPLVAAADATRCCIPCPVFDWTYANDFKRLTDGAAWVHVVGFILCGFLLLSNLVLPRTVARLNGLNVTLIICIMLLEIGFIIPLARQPAQCHDPVTPHGMHSDVTCAFAGAFVAFGWMATVGWIVLRALFMHLQICWAFTPAKYSYIAAHVTVWSITIGLTTAVLAHAGVSYRFGAYCWVNVGSISSYWGWLLAFGGIALLLQLATFAYCIKVYLTAALLGRQHLGSASAGSVGSSHRKANAWAAVRRLQQVLVIQWRSLAIVFFAIFTTAFVCIVFIVLDNSYTVSAFDDTDRLIPWLVCILTTQDKNQCLQYTDAFIIPESVAAATIFILAFVGIEAFFLLCRWDIFPGWWRLLTSPFTGKGRRASTDSADFFSAQQQVPSSHTISRPLASERRSLVTVDAKAPMSTCDRHMKLERAGQRMPEEKMPEMQNV